MTWTEEVCANRIQVGRREGEGDGKLVSKTVWRAALHTPGCTAWRSSALLPCRRLHPAGPATRSDKPRPGPVQVARTQGTRAGLAQVAKRRLLPAPAPRPNSGVGPIALVGALLAASLCWSREGHKLRGRKLPPLLERLRRLLGGDTGGSARRSVRAAGPAQPRAPPAQQRPPADAVDRRALAAAAAEQRLREQAQVRVFLGSC